MFSFLEKAVFDTKLGYPTINIVNSLKNKNVEYKWYKLAWNAYRTDQSFKI